MATHSTDQEPMPLPPTAEKNGTKEQLIAPVARKKNHVVRSPHGDRQDEYYWLRDDDRKDPQVLAYLRAENDYKEAMLAGVRGLRRDLYKEIVDRIKQDDSTVPYRDRGYYYYSRYQANEEYMVVARKSRSLAGSEQVMIDANKLAKNHEYFHLGQWRVSPDGNLLAFGQDTVGRFRYEIHFKDLRTGQFLSDKIPNTTSSMAWADDNRTLLYVEKDPVTLLGVRVKRHTLGTPVDQDTIVYEEKDHSYYMGVRRTGDHRYLVIWLNSTTSDELRYLPAGKPRAVPRVLAKREPDLKYFADHIDGRWIIRTNWNAKNFRIMQVKDRHAGTRSRWKQIVPHDPDVFIGRFQLFRDFLVISERAEGLQRIRVRGWRSGKDTIVRSDESAYSADISVNAEQDTPWLRYRYTSLTTPRTTYEVNMQTGQRKLLKTDPVLGGFESSNYQTTRLWAPARDGTKIPVSIVHHKDTTNDGAHPLYQYGYGSYGYSIDPEFRPQMVSLLDRGFFFAIAHVRGGQEMGRSWYEEGKLLNKKNTFTDFIDVTKYLIANGYAAPGKVVAAGGSAGGLLMGAIANMRPDLYKVIVSRVPFVDVITTMLDESIPLTTNEFDEWGNPKDKTFYNYMLSYSPYDNVREQDYPAILVFTGLWDSQVQYFEPAKWVARLRDRKTDSNPPLFHINMEAGHGGKSGRFRRHKERALEFAFILQQLGVAPPTSGPAQ